MGFLCKPSKTTSKTSIPKWLDEGAQDVFKKFQDYYNTKFTPYKGQRVAGFNADQKGAFEGFRDMQGPGVGEEALDMVRAGSGSALPGMDQYQNKYLDQVLGTAIRKINEGAATNRQRLDSSANMAGAFGDTGYGLERSRINQDTQTAIGDTAGEVGARGFETALGASQADLARKTAGGQALVSTEGSAQNNLLQRLTALLTGGTMQQGNQQAGLDAKFQEFLRQQGDLPEKLKMLLASIGGVPHGSSTTAEQPNTGWSSLMGSLIGRI